MTPMKTGDSTSIVKGVQPSTPSLKGNHHRHNCLPGHAAPITGYGSHGLGKHCPDVPQQFEPAGEEPMRQHRNYAGQGLGVTGKLPPVLGK